VTKHRQPQEDGLPAVEPDAAVPDHDPPLGSNGRLASNTAALVLSRLTIAIVGWGGTVLIARQLGTEGFGQFTVIFSILGMLSIVTDLGVGRVAVSALLDRDRDRATFAGSYIILRTVLGVLGYGIAMAVVLVADYPDVVVQATAVAGLVVVLATPSHAYDVAFQVRDRLAPLAIIAVVGRLGQLALTIVIVLRGGTLLWLVVPAVLNDLIVLAWKVPAAHRLLDFRYRVDVGVWRDLLKEALPLATGAAFVTLYYRIDSVMLSKLDSFEAAGLYGVAYKFVDLVHFVPAAVAIALLAPLAASWPDTPARFHAMTSYALRVLAVAGGAAFIGFWLFSADAAELLYGSAYREAGTATAIVVSAEVLAFAAHVAITALIATGRHRWYPIIGMIGLALNLGLNSVLIPAWSFEGAAVATLATEAVVLGLMWSQFTRIPGWANGRQLHGLGRLPVAIAVGLGVGFATDQVVHWIVAAAAAIVAYGATAVWLGVIDREALAAHVVDRTRRKLSA
jgi:O-antigen/teichoic acid export membrane protein